jgi:SAP domain-containing ribonucleoprotein
VDSELEKRKQRAARFGIPLVENAPESTGKRTAAPLPQAALPDVRLTP